MAVTETFGGDGTALGAVYKPLLLTVPHAEPEQPVPDTLQLTLVSVDPVTVAVNCLVSPAFSVALVGEILTTTGGRTVTVAVPDLVASACEVAVTVTVGGLGTELGAVYSPEVVMVPQVDPVQPVPFKLQVTAVFDVPETVAVNCCLAPSKTCAVAGETVTTIGATTVTIAVPDLVGSACDVAMTATLGGLGMLAGAV